MSKQANIEDYETPREGTKLSYIDGENFTIIDVKQHDYHDKDETIPGVMITTKESFDIEK